MTTAKSPDPATPLVLDARERAAMDAYMRILRLAEDITQAILAELREPAIAQNVPFMVIVGLSLNGPMRPSALVRLTGLTSGGVSGVLERLEGLGLLARDFGGVPGDRRGIVVRLTDRGEALATSVSRLLDVTVTRLLQDLGPILEQRAALVGPAADPASVAPGEVLSPLGLAGPGAASSPDPRGRENMDIFLHLVRFGEATTQATEARLQGTWLRDNVPMLALYGLLVRGTLRPTEVAALTNLTSGGTSGLLDRLEAEGLIVREYGLVPADRRAVVVRLTERGYADALVAVEERVGRVDQLLDELAPIVSDRLLRQAAAGPV